MTHTLSFSQFGELLAMDAERIAAIALNRKTRTITVEEHDMSQTSGAFPALTKDGKTIGGKKAGGKKR